jgi:uncharacterized membrane protein YfcA
MASVTAGGATADAGVGFLNGVLGGITGLAGLLVTIWCGLRGWPKDRQRTIFQPVAVAIFAMSAAWLGIKGAVSADTIRLFLLGLPVLLAGTWLGVKLYWPPRRNLIPKGGVGSPIGVERGADFLTGLKRAKFH